MKRKDVLYAAAEMCGKRDAAAYIRGEAPVLTEQAKADADFLQNALQLALFEIADRRCAPISEEEVDVPAEGFVAYSQLSDRPLQMLSVNGKTRFQSRADGFFAPQGKIAVRYARFPREGRGEDEIDVAAGVPAEAAVCLVAAAMFTKEGLIEQATQMHDRFERLLFSGRQRKNIRLPAARWRI